jgi:hypothetical protein
MASSLAMVVLGGFHYIARLDEQWLLNPEVCIQKRAVDDHEADTGGKFSCRKIFNRIFESLLTPKAKNINIFCPWFIERNRSNYDGYDGVNSCSASDFMI